MKVESFNSFKKQKKLKESSKRKDKLHAPNKDPRSRLEQSKKNKHRHGLEHNRHSRRDKDKDRRRDKMKDKGRDKVRDKNSKSAKHKPMTHHGGSSHKRDKSRDKKLQNGTANVSQPPVLAPEINVA